MWFGLGSRLLNVNEVFLLYSYIVIQYALLHRNGMSDFSQDFDLTGWSTWLTFSSMAHMSPLEGKKLFEKFESPIIKSAIRFYGP